MNTYNVSADELSEMIVKDIASWAEHFDIPVEDLLERSSTPIWQLVKMVLTRVKFQGEDTIVDPVGTVDSSFQELLQLADRWAAEGTYEDGGPIDASEPVRHFLRFVKEQEVIGAMSDRTYRAMNVEI